MRSKAGLWKGLKIVFALTLVGLLIYLGDPQRLLRVSLDINPLYLTLALIAFLGLLFFEGCRLRLTLARFGAGARDSVYLLFVGLFFANLMPGNLGAEAYRVMYLRSKGYGAAAPAAILAVGKIAGLLSVLLPAIVYILVEWQNFGKRLVTFSESLDLSNLALVFIGIALVVPIAICSSKTVRGRVKHSIWKMREAVFSITKAEALLLFLISLVTQLMRMAMVGLLVVAYGGAIYVSDLIPVTALTVLSMFFPVGMGGLGIREGALAGSLFFFGVPVTIGVGVALMSRVFLYIAGFVGFVLWSFRRDIVSEVQDKKSENDIGFGQT